MLDSNAFGGCSAKGVERIPIPPTCQKNLALHTLYSKWQPGQIRKSTLN
jgi:hypothetical protein